MPARGYIASLIGNRYGRLTVVGYAGQNKHRRSMWKCRCECGTESVVQDAALKTGNTTSCGCFHREGMISRFTTHGQSNRVGKPASPEYESWAAMLARVRAKSGRRYQDYGARGITVCERWLTFENFLADMGKRPDGTSLDREDNDGNYEPGNCRWATPSQQCANQRRSKKYRHKYPELAHASK